jgi:short-subunit dehydrogenase
VRRAGSGCGKIWAVSSFGNAIRRRARRAGGEAVRLVNHPLGRIAPAIDPRRFWERLGGHPSLDEVVEGKVVMITGASSGIGEAAARRIAEAGGTVLLIARSAETLNTLRAEIEKAGGKATAYPCDLSDLEAADAMIEQVLADHGGIDILINSAGRSIRRSVEFSQERFHDFERTMQLNYFGAVRLIVRLLPSIRERRGQVINISSAGVQTRTPRFSGYIASKAALDAFSDAVQAETLDDGVRFTTISLPLVRTPMIEPTDHYDGFPSLSTEQAAAQIAEAIIRRPRRIAPTFAHLVTLTDQVNPGLMDALRNRGYRMFPETGDSAEPEAEATPTKAKPKPKSSKPA